MGSIDRSAGEDPPSSPTSQLPYWQINVPSPQRSVTCPDFLQNICSKDTKVISTPDSQYHILSWPSVQSIIASNRLGLFQRVPSQLRRYLSFIHNIKKQYGSIMNFVVSERLYWELPIAPERELGVGPGRPSPFETGADVKVLWNDWPYGIDERIVHLVVWTKFELQDDPVTDDLTAQARGEIQEYVNKVFCEKIGSENVIWFKNWKSLKSVHAVEHFHVMLFDPPKEFVDEVTGGDVPLSRRV